MSVLLCFCYLLDRVNTQNEAPAGRGAHSSDVEIASSSKKRIGDDRAVEGVDCDTQILASHERGVPATIPKAAYIYKPIEITTRSREDHG